MTRYIWRELKVSLPFGRSLRIDFRFKSHTAVGQYAPLKWSVCSFEIEFTWAKPAVPRERRDDGGSGGGI